ncbi:MAG TPA: class I mannose-6-phosphate isomerase, partial [Kiritimatiellia bacterium]|nr:class I mannose-6-phosphate isomerase [Kiritimatiellia bacterium]
CDFFKVRRLALQDPLDVAVDGSSFHALFVTAGAVTLSVGGERVPLRAGQSALVPADAGVYRLEPDAAARLLVTTL